MEKGKKSHNFVRVRIWSFTQVVYFHYIYSLYCVTLCHWTANIHTVTHNNRPCSKCDHHRTVARVRARRRRELAELDFRPRVNIFYGQFTCCVIVTNCYLLLLRRRRKNKRLWLIWYRGRRLAILSSAGWSFLDSNPNMMGWLFCAASRTKVWLADDVHYWER